MVFNLFKSKPTLRELIPRGFVDIHSHILPGIDDGAKNVKESINLISEMNKLGFSKVIGTPHTYEGLYNNTLNTIKDSFDKLLPFVKTKIKLGYATEYMLNKSIIQKAKAKNLLCLKDNYVLVEMSYISEPLNLREIIYEIKVNGYKPILAHPERYLFIKDFKSYYELKEIGCLFQINLLSAVDYYGQKVRKNLDKLILNDLVDFVGSDIHKLHHVKAFEKKIKIKNLKKFEKSISNNNIFLD